MSASGNELFRARTGKPPPPIKPLSAKDIENILKNIPPAKWNAADYFAAACICFAIAIICSVIGKLSG